MRRRSLTLFAPSLFGLLLLWISDAQPAHAGTEMKRSAGEMNRSYGNRRGNTLSSQTRGRSARMSATRKSYRPQSAREKAREAAEAEERDAAQASAAGSSSSYVRQERSRFDSEDSDAEAPQASPTLGRACIYGARDEVLFRPKGARCRGDAVPNASSPARRGPAAAPDPDRRGTRPHPPAAQRSLGLAPGEPRKKRVPRKSSAGCLYGPDGKVIFEPAGSDCRS